RSRQAPSPLAQAHPAKYSGRHKHRLSLYIVGRLIQELIGGGYTHEYTRRYASSKAPLAPWSASESKDVALGTAAAATPSAAAPSTAAATPANANVFFSGLRNVRSRLGINPEEEPPSQLKQRRLPLSLLGPHDLGGAVPPLHPRLVFPSMRRRLHSQGAVRAALLRAIAARVDEDVQSEYHLELADWADKYETEALAMLDHCHRFDPRRARRLVTYRLAEFGGHTCMSLAYTSRSMRFLSHACPQVILNDLWYGGIRESGQLTGLRVVLLCGILAACPPAFFLLLRAKFLSFKSLAELRDQPQTREEFDEFAQQEGSDSGDEASEAEQAARTAATAAAGAPAQAFVEPESLRNLMRSMPADSLGDKLRRMESPDVEAADADVDGASKNPRATEAAKAAASQDASPARQALLSAGGDCKDWSGGSMS
uniref:CRAL-TRIO domain-containing protein n=1 Tax=Macrostomum lignano TaxID=282301 RepID=A0A1I8F644_9PLAT